VGEIYRNIPNRAWRPTQPLMLLIPSICREEIRRGMVLITHPIQRRGLKKGSVISLFPLWALNAGYSVYLQLIYYRAYYSITSLG